MMSFLFQQFWHTAVRLTGSGLQVESSCCGSERELLAWMEVDPQSFEIQSARWEMYRAPGRTGPVAMPLNDLQGVTAYFGCGPRLRLALAPTGMDEAVDLFAEAVRGVIQAETFLIEERGFSGAAAYEAHWHDLYKDACRYYSYPERLSGGWFEYIGHAKRSGLLFSRAKSQVLQRRERDNLLSGHLSDSFHSLSVELELTADESRVVAAKGELLRAPDPVCSEATRYLENLRGLVLPGLTKKELARLLGGPDGCVHLIDLLADGAGVLTS